MYKWKLITNFIFVGSLTGLCILFLVYICENYNWALLEKQPPPLTLFTRAILLLLFTRPSKKTGALTNSGWVEASSLTPSLTKALHYSHDLSLNAILCITSFLWNFNYKKVCLVMWKSSVQKLTSSWFVLLMQMLWIDITWSTNYEPSSRHQGEQAT